VERSFRFPATLDAPWLARRALDGWLDDLLGSERGNDVRLLTTELITNAIRHGGVSSLEQVIVDVRTADDLLSVSVEQPTSAGRAAIRMRDVGSGGFGLRLVDRLADDWGVVQGIPGSVWFGVRRSTDG
jgi:anti-sigma regulatory factor (Ser/Thr protein kinase)